MSEQRHQLPGVAVAGVTALISGVSVYVNSYGVRAGLAPDAYTTAKNVVAWVVLGAIGALGWRSSRRGGSSMAANFVARPAPRGADARRVRPAWARWLGLAYVGVIGGGLAFVLFFDGLAASQPAPAAFWRDTLVIWVALLALVVVKERIRWWNVLAIILLVAGEVVVAGGVGSLTNHAAIEVLASSVLWGVEVVVARWLLRDLAPGSLAQVRMGVGALALAAYLGASGSWSSLAHLTGDQWRWVLLTGLLLGAYVATWMTALARARALDVTSVLVGSALVTWLLEYVGGAAAPASTTLGLALIALGVALVLGSAWRAARSPRSPRSPQSSVAGS